MAVVHVPDGRLPRLLSPCARDAARPVEDQPQLHEAALARAGIEKPFRVWHGLRHTALTHAAAVNPQAYVQMLAGHSQGSITERYVHAAQVAFPGAAERAEARIFAEMRQDEGLEA